MTDIPGLGNGKPELKVVREEHPLPSSRKELVVAFESILARGGVKKFVIELGQPLRVDRYMKFDEVGPDAELLPDDLYFAVRNAPITPYVVDNEKAVDGMQVLFHMFQRAWDQGLTPKALLVNDAQNLFDWLGVGKAVLRTNAFGVEIATHKEIPSDVLLFVLTKVGEPDVITVSLKISMEE